MDPKEAALSSLKSAFRIFGLDLQALPEEAFDKRFGGKSRTVADIVREVNMVNDHMCMTIRGEDPYPWPEGWITAPEEVRTKAAVIASFEKSSQGVLATIENMSEEQLDKPWMTENGETTGFSNCRHMSIHLWYHSGQLNFIQTLMGDDTWHWN